MARKYLNIQTSFVKEWQLVEENGKMKSELHSKKMLKRLTQKYHLIHRKREFKKPSLHI